MVGRIDPRLRGLGNISVQVAERTDDLVAVMMSTLRIWKVLMATAVLGQLAVVKAGISMLSEGSWMFGGVLVVALGWAGVIATCAAVAYVDSWPERIALASLVFPAVASFFAVGWLVGLVELGFRPLALAVLVVSGLWVFVVKTSPTWPRPPAHLIVLSSPR